MHGAPRLAVVIVTYNSAQEIGRTLAALDAEREDGDEVVVVDNASADGTAAIVRGAAPWAALIETGANLGFAGGCNVGAARTTAPILLFLNPDASPEPGCLAALRATATRTEWGAWQPLVTMPGGQEINTAGGVIHFLGFGWAGRCGEPVGVGVQPDHVAFPTGAALCIRRAVWEALDGFDERYFMYGEDLDLGLRLWLAGWEVGIEPHARVRHHYAFIKGAQKWYLLERNRWRTVLATYPTPLLALLLPALIAFEIALLPVAAADGWLAPKLRAQAAVLRDLPEIARRRRRTQVMRTIDAGEFAALLTASLDSQYIQVPRWGRTLESLQKAYWRLVRTLLTGRSRR